MIAASPHRWFRFSLRTLFVLVAVAAVGTSLAPSAVTVFRRRQAIAALRAQGGRLYLRGEFADAGDSDEARYQLPLIRRSLGDEAVLCATLPKGAGQDELEDFRKLFPEAERIDLPGTGGGFFKRCGLPPPSSRFSPNIYHNDTTDTT